MSYISQNSVIFLIAWISIQAKTKIKDKNKKQRIDD